MKAINQAIDRQITAILTDDTINSEIKKPFIYELEGMKSLLAELK